MLPPAETPSCDELKRAGRDRDRGGGPEGTTTITLDQIPEFLARLGETGRRSPEA